MRAMVLVTPKRANREDFRAAVQSVPFDQLEVKFTDSREHAIELTERACRQGVDRMVSAGGDGSLNNVLRGALASGCDIPIGLLPMGTGNDFARHVGIPEDDLAQALHIALHGKPTPVDVGYCNDQPFLNAVVIGQPAEITRQTPAAMKATLGGAAYGIYGLFKLYQSQAVQFDVKGGDWSWSGDALGVAIGNGRFAGGGFAVAPQAALDDGKLDIMILPDMGVPQAVSTAKTLQTVEYHQDTSAVHQTPVVQYLSREVRIAVEQARGANVDGEPVKGDRFELRIEPQRVRFMMPASNG